MNVFIIIIIVVVILIIIYKFSKRASVAGDTEIYQIDNFNNKIYNEYLNYDRPIVITNYLTEFPSFEVLCLDVLKDIDIDIIIQPKNKLAFKKKKFMNLRNYINSINTTNDVIYNNYSYFKHFTFEQIIPNYKTLTKTLNPKYCLNIFPNNFNTPITKNLNSKLLFLIYDGEVLINLLNPNNMNNQKLNDMKFITLDNSRILFDSEEKLELEPVSIICRPGKIVLIPEGWWYYIESVKPTVLVKLY
jgi:hypothetical protein